MARLAVAVSAAEPVPLGIHWENFLTISGPRVPGSEVRIHYLEAYCRAGSTNADWGQHMVICHQAEIVGTPTDREIQLYRNDVNPRPLSSLVPSNGLCGAFSGNNQWILATAWEPYQKLFQGVVTCMHSDFRIGGLKPGETKHIRGKLYLVPADAESLLRRYDRDFPEQK